MNVLIVDDHTAVREGLKHLLEVEWPAVVAGLASRPTEGLSMLSAGHWDLMILDITHPGKDGFELIREIKSRAPGTRVLIHSMHPEDHFGVRAIRAGAEGYLTKDAPVKALLNAVRKIVAGGRYVTPMLAELIAGALSTTAPDQSVDSLSDRELQILRRITAGVSPGDIALELQLSIKTVSTYRSRLLEKLHLKTTADLIRFGLENSLGE